MRLSRSRPMMLAAGLTAALAASLVTAAPASADVQVDRLSGDTRYDTGVLVSQDTFDDPAEVTTVHLATGQSFPDALSAGAAAYALGGPVLLTEPTALTEAARDELRRLQPDRVVVVGGEVAISKAVVDAVAGDAAIGAQVERLGGDTRYDTAALVVRDAFPDTADTLFIATGASFPDALSGVPAAARFDAPLLLTDPGVLPAATRTAIEALAPKRIVLLGGEVAVSRAVEDELETLADDVDRLAGLDRYATSVGTSQDAFVGARTVYVATGQNFPDALTGGPAAGRAAGPLLLTETDELPDAIASELLRLNPRRVVILGGETAVSQAVRDRIVAVLDGATSLPSGAVPDLAYSSLSNDPDDPFPGLQTIKVGTLGGAFEVLTNPAEDEGDIAAVMSDDGRRVAFLRGESSFSGLENLRPYLIDVAVGASSTRQLFDPSAEFAGSGGCDVRELTWRPDGEQLAFICIGREDAEGMALPNTAHVVDLRGQTTRVMTGGSADTTVTGVEYAPDGLRLAVAIVDLAQPESSPVYSRIVTVDSDAPAAGVTPLATSPEDGGTYEALYDLAWSADGTAIAASWGGSTTQVAVIDPETGDSLLRLEAGNHVVQDISSDGAQVLVITRQGAGDDLVRLVPVDGSDPIVVADGTTLLHGYVNTADLSSDDQTVLYDDTSGRTTFGDATLWVVGTDGSARRQLFADPDVLNFSGTFNDRTAAAADEGG